MNILSRLIITICAVLFTCNNFCANAAKKRLLETLSPDDIYDKSYIVGNYYAPLHTYEVRKIKYEEEEAFLFPIVEIYSETFFDSSYLLVDSKDIDRFVSFLELLKSLYTSYNLKDAIDYRGIISKRNCVFGDIIGAPRNRHETECSRFNVKGVEPVISSKNDRVVGICYSIKGNNSAYIVTATEFSSFGLKDIEIVKLQEIIESSLQNDDSYANPETLLKIGEFSLSWSDKSYRILLYKNNIYIEGKPDNTVPCFLWFKKKELLPFINWLKEVREKFKDYTEKNPDPNGSYNWTDYWCGIDSLKLGGTIISNFDAKMEIISGEAFCKENSEVMIWPKRDGYEYSISIVLFYLMFSNYQEMDQLINELERISSSVYI